MPLAGHGVGKHVAPQSHLRPAVAPSPRSPAFAPQRPDRASAFVALSQTRTST